MYQFCVSINFVLSSANTACLVSSFWCLWKWNQCIYMCINAFIIWYMQTNKYKNTRVQIQIIFVGSARMLHDRSIAYLHWCNTLTKLYEYLIYQYICTCRSQFHVCKSHLFRVATNLEVRTYKNIVKLYICACIIGDTIYMYLYAVQ